MDVAMALLWPSLSFPAILLYSIIGVQSVSQSRKSVSEASRQAASSVLKSGS